jgi:alpha-glucosidase
MQKIILTILLFISSIGVFSQKFSSKILPLPNEKWYGAYTAKASGGAPKVEGSFQPYKANEKLNDLKTDNRLNQAAPLLISTMGRYVWSNEPFAFEFNDGTLSLYSETEKIEPVVAGKTLRDAYLGVMKTYFPPSKKMPHPLMFSKPQFNTWMELNYGQNEKTVMKYANDISKNGFPMGVLMIDDKWSKYYGDFEFDPELFPNPKAMIDEFHSKGIKLMLWLTPFISADSREFKALLKSNCLVMKKDGKNPTIIKWWQGYSACLDLSKPAAMEWLRGKLKNLQEKYGVDGFKFDGVDFDFYLSGSRIFINDDSNTTGPIQAELYAKLGAEFEFNELRASWKNGNQPVAQRLQDKRTRWDDLQLLVPDMISAGFIGQPFTCPDLIGGGLLSYYKALDFTKFDQELMVRSAQIQALMPMMQFSIAPWNLLDEKHLKACREAALLHTKMGNYLVELAQQATKDGEPIVRHLEYSFPQEGFESCDDQYMLGDKYLVCPMVTKGETREVRLPKGNWIDDLGAKHTGGKTITVNVPINRLVYFVNQKL